MQYWKELSSSEVHIFSSQSPECSAQEASLAGQETRSRSTTQQHPGSALLHPDGKPQLPADPPPLAELPGAYPRLWHKIALESLLWQNHVQRGSEDSFWTSGWHCQHPLQPCLRHNPLCSPQRPLLRKVQGGDMGGQGLCELRGQQRAVQPQVATAGTGPVQGWKEAFMGSTKGSLWCASAGSSSVEQRRAVWFWWMLNKLVYRKAGLHVYAQRPEGCLHALPFFVSTRQEISFSNGVKCRKNSTGR